MIGAKPDTKICGLCQREVEKLVDSHLYPAAVGRELQKDSKFLLSIPIDTARRPGVVHRHGVFDRIVCDTCERSFGAADDYYVRFYRNRDSGIRDGGRDPASWWYYAGVDHALLQRFFLTCLFRAHLSQRPGFENVALGPFAEKLRAALLAPAAIVEGFDTILSRETHLLADVIGSPYAQRMGGIRFFRVTVPGFSAAIKVDRQVAPREFSARALGREEPLIALDAWRTPPSHLREFAKVKERHGPKIDALAKSGFGKTP